MGLPLSIPLQFRTPGAPQIPPRQGQTTTTPSRNVTLLDITEIYLYCPDKAIRGTRSTTNSLRARIGNIYHESMAKSATAHSATTETCPCRLTVTPLSPPHGLTSPPRRGPPGASSFQPLPTPSTPFTGVALLSAAYSSTACTVAEQRACQHRSTYSH